MKDKSIKGFKIGDTAEIIHTITKKDIDQFIELTGDTNPLHTDRRFAEKTHLKGIIAHGMLSASFLSTVIGKHIPGEGALWVSQSIEFLLPVRIDDVLYIRATVVDIHKSLSLMDLNIEVINQYEQIVLRGQSRVKVLTIETPNKEETKKQNQEKVVIITGASRGIGAATAERLARDGFSVVINYKSDREGAEDVSQSIKENGGSSLIVMGDVTNPKDITKLIRMTAEQFGSITALVNNASGKIIHKPFEQLCDEELDDYFNINFHSPIRLIREVLPYFEKAGSGCVVNVASIMADNVPPAHMLAYTAAKAALISATRSLAVEYGSKGFRFNVVSPGMTDTQLIADFPEKSRMITKMQTPLRRLAKPEDVANGIAFLLSDEASYITGHTMRICGGTVML